MISHEPIPHLALLFYTVIWIFRGSHFQNFMYISIHLCLFSVRRLSTCFRHLKFCRSSREIPTQLGQGFDGDHNVEKYQLQSMNRLDLLCACRISDVNRWKSPLPMVSCQFFNCPFASPLFDAYYCLVGAFCCPILQVQQVCVWIAR